jgi:hypothetical protein
MLKIQNIHNLHSKSKNMAIFHYSDLISKMRISYVYKHSKESLQND